MFYSIQLTFEYIHNMYNMEKIAIIFGFRIVLKQLYIRCRLENIDKFTGLDTSMASTSVCFWRQIRLHMNIDVCPSYNSREVNNDGK